MLRTEVLIQGHRAENVVLNGATITYGRQFPEQAPTPASAFLTLVPLDVNPNLADLYPGLGFVSQTLYDDTYDDVYAETKSKLNLGTLVELKVYDDSHVESVRFKGHVAAVDYRPEGISLTLVSQAELLTRVTLLPAAWPSESEVARVQRIASHASFPIYIEGANTATIAPYPTGDTRVSVWDLLSKLALDCNAVLYANRNGDVVYRTRAADTGRMMVNLVPQGVLEDQLQMTQETGSIRNHVEIDYPDGQDTKTITVKDDASIAAYGKRMYSDSVLLAQPSAQSFAERVLGLWKEPYWLMPQATVVVPLTQLDIVGMPKGDLRALMEADLDDEVRLGTLPANAPVKAYSSRILGWVEALDEKEWTIQFSLDPNGWTWREPGDVIPNPPTPSPSRNPQLTHADVRGRFRIVNYDGNLTYVVKNISGGGTAVLDAGRGEYTVDAVNSVWEVTTTQQDADVAPGLMERKQYTYRQEDQGYWVSVPVGYSYPARAETYQTGTAQHQGDNQQPHCPATWSYAHTDCNGVWCRHADGRFERNGWLGGCPGGWYGCNCGACCTDVPTYGTRYHCDSGGSLSGTTCYGTRDEQRWVSNIVSVRDSTPTGYVDTGDEWVRSR
jgi:hypothetical protein